MIGNLNGNTMARMTKFLIQNPMYLEDVNAEWFDSNNDIMKIIKCIKSITSYSPEITKEDIMLYLENNGEDVDFYSQYYDAIMENAGEMTRLSIKTLLGWLSWLKLRDAMGDSLALMADIKDASKFVDIATKCRAAIENSQIASFGTSPGMDFFNIDCHKPDNGRYINSPWSLTPKGYELGTLTCYLGEANIGKSIFLCNEAANTARRGIDVLFASFEMSEQRIASRLAGSMLGITCDEYDIMVSNDKNKLKSILHDCSEGCGSIRIKQFPTSIGTVEDLRHEIHKMRDKGLDPKKVVVDYIGIMASKNRRVTDLYEKLKNVTEELRALAIEEQVAIVTACQINRSGFGQSDIGFENIAECAAILHTCDTIFGITQTEDYRAAHLYKLKALKIRDGGGKGITTTINIDYAHMKLEEDMPSAMANMELLKPQLSPSATIPCPTMDSPETLDFENSMMNMYDPMSGGSSLFIDP